MPRKRRRFTLFARLRRVRRRRRRRSAAASPLTVRRFRRLTAPAVVALAVMLTAAGAAALTGCWSNTTGGAGSPTPHANAPHGRNSAAPLPPPRQMPRQIRAIWIARYHYLTADDVRRAIANSAEAGFNTILWQVRGDGTVCYPSRIEPWAPQFGFRDPGFDPLAIAIDEAHQRGLRIEAWMNVMPGWNGVNPPSLASQLWNARPEWFLADKSGKRQPLGDFYVILNPCLPEVRQHLTSLVREMLRNYALDGVHLDYIRYAWETTRDARKRYPRDARTLALYREETGLTPEQDAKSWDNWRVNAITRIVAAIRTTIDQERPGASLTAAVKPNPDEAFRDYMQNAAAWLRTGLIDAAMPMAYSTKPGVFERDINAYRSAAPQGRTVPGVGVYKETAAQLRAQLDFCAARGGEWCAFSYEALFDTPGDPRGGPAYEKLRAERAERLAVVREYQRRGR